MAPIPRYYLPSWVTGSTFGTITCPANSYASGVSLSDSGGEAYLTYVALSTCSSRSMGRPPSLGASTPIPQQLVQLSCTGGFDAIRGVQSASPSMQLAPMLVSLRCSTDGAWSSPGVGTGAGVYGNSSYSQERITVACPIGAVISGFKADATSSLVGRLYIMCTPADMSDTWVNPASYCPRAAGYDFLPSVSNSSLNTRATYTSANSSGLDAALAACNTDAQCFSVNVYANGGDSMDQAYGLQDGSYNAWQTQQPLEGAGDRCVGTLVKTPTAPRQFYCLSSVVLTGSVIDSYPITDTYECVVWCSTHSDCTAFSMSSPVAGDRPVCSVYSSAFSSAKNVSMSSTVTSSCWVAHDPWWPLLLAVMLLPRSDANEDCVYYLWSGTSNNVYCYLMSDPWFGSGSNGFINGPHPDASRTCVKTPMHRSQNGMAPTGTPSTYGSVCFAGIHLGGTPFLVSSSAKSSTQCARLCARHGCGHWSLLLSGACTLGPAGLFAALTLAEGGRRVVLLERGQPVEQRGRDIGALFVRRRLNPDSNLCYGEGGAGTWSDGKLTTRIGRNADPALVDFGAPESILVAGKPHLGTDALVRILKRFRAHLQAAGVDVRFGAAVEGLLVQQGRCEGVTLAGGEELRASAVVLAVGHSARPLYRTLAAEGVALSAKPFALGFRIEHPQALIDEIQYGAEDAEGVMRGKGRLPVADYTLAVEVMDRLSGNDSSSSRSWGGVQGREEVVRAAASQAPGIAPPTDGDDGASDDSASRVQQQQQQQQQQQYAPQGRGQEEDSDKRGVYSFCMCPGGQIVPTSTSEQELCINGMSFRGLEKAMGLTEV
ncbi:hypothetical protein TSOC_006143 [Tetrabaena socialis]|uniref:Apple domain-containing protein n=1 Tax=Tetrabaena socialis TaxID=47790 RepID=A0A2J8A4H3_9CHLO|nr:hypothetical protein TSOC_006143 [Tetrabaena socialis]|eukprot:PNH07405.1 hypothetical protein TSOC_006143 [Tetrabaena socialis]